MSTLGEPARDSGQGWGSTAEEALRLLATLQWIGSQESANTGEGGAVPRPGHDPAYCRACPICQALAALRRARPRAADHLEAAMANLVAAFREAFTTPGAGDPPPATPAGPAPSEPSQRAPDGPPVEHIPISD